MWILVRRSAALAGHNTNALQREVLEELGGRHRLRVGLGAGVLQARPEVGRLVSDARMAGGRPEQAAAEAAQRQHLGVLVVLADAVLPGRANKWLSIGCDNELTKLYLI